MVNHIFAQKDDRISNKYKNSHIFSGRYRLRPHLSIVRHGKDEVRVPWTVLHIPAMENWHIAIWMVKIIMILLDS